MSEDTRMQEAQELLMPFYETILSGLSRSLGSAAALEITQEAFSRAMRFCRNRGLPYQPLRWLRVIARNVRRTRAKRERLKELVVPWNELQRLVEASQGITHLRSVSGFDREDLAMAINALKPSMQRLVRLHYFEGWSYGELSTEMGIGRQQVKCKVFRARRRIERHLRRMRCVEL